MSFVERFGPPPPGEEPVRHLEPARPEWFGPPDGELGVSVHLGAVLGRSERGVVALSRATVYSTGLRLHVVARARGVDGPGIHRLLHDQGALPPGDEPTDYFLRLGLELPGGVLVSNLGGRGRRPRFEEKPDGPVFFESGGGGGSGSDDSVQLRPAYWLWPLPEPGPLLVSCEWPVVAIPLATVEIDGTELRAAAERVVTLWS